ncbi:indolepyruvate oxidoreductase subunit beta [Oceanispirochaeta sp.]|jgi:indolepyruvate ferredoxin oxidoreductase beta subunit|uniref:indolepyruvate oxidoreductase subunit beta n=1 Tax=Oceanispirochaeta sp. TaxID=2035350 RepID=UPI002619D06B|nr:indolepyruvate oxidoreductase subunit beta [Oceanispirochaeta sp.]MDA3958881.1 indolepyruvate oxidoreductase subunit beta [Oceanispirochaeta sp.]
MKYDIILAGVGGQGVLSLASVIATAAAKAGFKVRQSEVHGMAQRGGAVMAHMRLADGEIFSDLIGQGTADMVISMEPLESLRYLPWLSPEGILVTSITPVKNISNYPEESQIMEALSELPSVRLVDDKALAKEAGSSRAGNMVIVGAASANLPLGMKHLKAAVDSLFSRKGEAVVQANYKALDLGSHIS